VQRKAQNKKDFLEHVSMIKDIELFLKKGSSFDLIKTATLFIKFNGLAQGKWTSNTFKAYRELKNYALSYNDFEDFIIEQEVNRENLRQEKINKLSENLIEKSKTLKEFITKNLTSKKIPRALELISKIEKVLTSEDINRLDRLNQEVGDWISNMHNNKKSNTKLISKDNENKKISLAERFAILEKKVSFKEGKCLGTLLYATRKGWKMSKWASGFLIDKNAQFQSYINNFIKNNKICKFKSMKTSIVLNNRLNCIAQHYKQTKGFSDHKALSYANFTLGMSIAEYHGKRYPTPVQAFSAGCNNADLY